MKFEEIKNVITIPKYQNSFIYFLLKENEVVYVGQTKKGLIRPLTHKDKEYDTIKILYCGVKELDLLEDKYIKKYEPTYNKAVNYSVNYSLHRARNKIRRMFDDNKFNLPRLKKIIKELNINVYIHDSTPYIDVEDFSRIVNYIKEMRNI